MEVFVLDACGLIAYLRKEFGHQKILSIFDSAIKLNAKIILHAATLCEVYYDFLRVSGINMADEVLADAAKLPIFHLNTIDFNFIRAAGYFKTNYKISFADSLVLAAAKLNEAKVITSDHHEFDVIEKSGEVAFEWIR